MTFTLLGGLVIVVGLLLAIRKYFSKPQPPVKRYECICGTWVTESEVHKVISTEGALSDEGFRLGPGEGTAMVAEYCSEHCPGGCNRKHP